MSVSLREVIESGGYDLTTRDDCNWLLSKRQEFEDLLEAAEDQIDQIDAQETIDNGDY